MKQPNQLKGSSYIIISAFFFATYGVWARLMSGTFDTFNQAWIRALLLLIVVGLFGVLGKKFKRIQSGDWKWFILISLMGGLNQAPYYFGFEHLNIGTATLLFYVALVVGAYLLGFTFFKEHFTRVKIFALLLAIIGLAIMYVFVLTPEQILPAICTIMAGLMGSAGVVFSKKLSHAYSETQIVFGYFVAMFPINLLLSLWVGEAIPPFSLTLPWFALIAYGVAHLVANATVVTGFKYLEPSIGGLIGTLEVVFAALLGVLLFQESLTTGVVCGSIVILIAIILPDAAALFKKFHGLPTP